MAETESSAPTRWIRHEPIEEFSTTLDVYPSPLTSVEAGWKNTRKPPGQLMIRTLGPQIYIQASRPHNLTGNFDPYGSSSDIMESAVDLEPERSRTFPVIPLKLTTCYAGAFYDSDSCTHGVRQSLHASNTLIRMRVPLSDQLCVITLDLLLNSFDRLEVFDGLDVKFGGRVFVYDDQRTWVQL